MVKKLKYITRFIGKNKSHALSRPHIPGLYMFLLVFTSTLLNILLVLLHIEFSVLWRNLLAAYHERHRFNSVRLTNDQPEPHSSTQRKTLFPQPLTVITIFR